MIYLLQRLISSIFRTLESTKSELWSALLKWRLAPKYVIDYQKYQESLHWKVMEYCLKFLSKDKYMHIHLIYCHTKLTLSQIYTYFYMSAVYIFWKQCGKRRNCLKIFENIYQLWTCSLQTKIMYPTFSPLSTMFSEGFLLKVLQTLDLSVKG